MARILLIDDDRALTSVLSLAFEDAGHTVSVAADGLAGLDAARTARPDAIVCDINLPRLDGFSLCRQLRQAGDRVPFVALTARDSEIDEAHCLELGADDYVTKPFSTRVLLARIGALLRREALLAGQGSERPLERGLLSLWPERLEARYGGVAVRLTVSEFRLLEALVRSPGVVVSRPRLLRAVRDDDSVVVERIIDTWVRRVRRKLEAVNPRFDALETIVGAGYRWKPDAG